MASQQITVTYLARPPPPLALTSMRLHQPLGLGTDNEGAVTVHTTHPKTFLKARNKVLSKKPESARKGRRSPRSHSLSGQSYLHAGVRALTRPHGAPQFSQLRTDILVTSWGKKVYLSIKDLGSPGVWAQGPSTPSQLSQSVSSQMQLAKTATGQKSLGQGGDFCPDTQKRPLHLTYRPQNLGAPGLAIRLRGGPTDTVNNLKGVGFSASGWGLGGDSNPERLV